MSDWEVFDPTYPMSAKPKAGCYVFFAYGKPLYVGQSSNVIRRMRQHRCVNIWDGGVSGHTATAWGDIPWGEESLSGKVKYAKRYGEHLMLEARLIRRLKPVGNGKGLCRGR